MEARWTFMVYLAGDNNLEHFGIQDLNEMKAVGSSSDLSVVAEFDSMSDRTTRRYYLTADQSLSADCVAELPTVNTGDPQALVGFISWATHMYPAEHFALVLWNHGSGWKDDDIYHVARAKAVPAEVSRGQMRRLASGKTSRSLFATTVEQMVMEATERAILFDDSAADFLDTRELSQVLAKTAPIGKAGFDVLGFDACLMSMLEVYYQIQRWGQVAVGSQENEPLDGWPYDAILTQLAGNPDMTADELGRVIVKEYVSFYRQSYSCLPVTQSAVSLAGLHPVANKVNTLANALIMGLSNRTIVDPLFRALRFAQRFSDHDYFDLGHFCRLLAESDPMGETGAAARQIADLLVGESSPVVAEGHHGPQMDNASGLSIYLPARVLSPLYGPLDFARESRWDEFLDVLLNPR